MSSRYIMPAAGAPLHLKLRRAGAGLTLLAAMLVWLMALPGLLARDGLTMRSDDCLVSGYRDPVSGRFATSRAFDRDNALEACRAAFAEARR